MHKLFFNEQFEKVNDELFPNKDKKKARAVEISNIGAHEMKNIVSRVGTRTIKFNKIIGLDNVSSQMDYYLPQSSVYIDSINFTEGGGGTIDYGGDPEHKPNLCQKHFYLKIPHTVTKFIIRTSILGTSYDGKAHWMIDLKSKFGVALSFVSGNSNPSNTEDFKNSSVLVNSYNKSENYFLGNNQICSLCNVVDDRYSPSQNMEISLFYENPE